VTGEKRSLDACQVSNINLLIVETLYHKDKRGKIMTGPGSDVKNNTETKNYDENSTEKSLTLPLNTTLLDKYNIMGLVAVTDLGAVYLVEDKRSHEIYAMKELRPSRASSDEDRDYAVDKFIKEAKLLQNLNFTSVPKIQKYFSFEGNHYIIMEFIEGLDLEGMVKSTGTPGLPQEIVIDWGIEICEVLSCLHNYNPPIIYRDMKPANIMIRNIDRSVVLIDFGIAFPMYEELKGFARTQIGTMGYMAPEQFHGKVSPSSDIFSLGGTLYFALTAQIQQVFNYIPMKTFVPDISDELDRIIGRTLKIRPEDRFASAADLKKALQNLKISLKEGKAKQEDEIKKALSEMKKTDNLIFSVNKINKSDFKAEEFKKTEDVEKKIEIIEEIEKLSDSEATGVLIDILMSSKIAICRKAAVVSLGKRKDPLCIEALVKKTKDKDRDVRLTSIETLGNFKTAESLKCLEDNLKHKDKIIKKSAITALEQMGDKKALNVLLKARKREGLFSIEMKRLMDKAIDKIDSSLEGSGKKKKSRKTGLFELIMRFFFRK